MLLFMRHPNKKLETILKIKLLPLHWEIDFPLNKIQSFPAPSKGKTLLIVVFWSYFPLFKSYFWWLRWLSVVVSSEQVLFLCRASITLTLVKGKC